MWFLTALTTFPYWFSHLAKEEKSIGQKGSACVCAAINMHWLPPSLTSAKCDQFGYSFVLKAERISNRWDTRVVPADG